MTFPSTSQHRLVSQLEDVLPAHSLLWHTEDTTPFECDGLTAYRERPLAVALPETEEQVAALLKTCHRLSVPVVARGAGTGLSGGAMPHAKGLTLSLAKFNEIVRIDVAARTAKVQCGVRNLAISEAVAPYGLYYAPDPSSQIACTIGGNVAENSGGVHCLKYGLTLHNVLAVRGFTMDGDLNKLMEVNAGLAKVALTEPPGARFPVEVRIRDTGTVTVTKLASLDTPVLRDKLETSSVFMMSNPWLNAKDLMTTPEQKQKELSAWYDRLSPEVKSAIAKELAERQARGPELLDMWKNYQAR